jgi:hypothetical protein
MVWQPKRLSMVMVVGSLFQKAEGAKRQRRNIAMNCRIAAGLPNIAELITDGEISRRPLVPSGVSSPSPTDIII